LKLKRLVIQGFKSFKDKTTIHFDNGITGVVGPNGCGKSNIVDALFWVMGEQSAKHLRGSTMKDVIFSGSSKYAPGVWAEVSLILENDEQKHIHIGQNVSCPSEIQITRKLYRDGETEYRINKVPCRLRDIQEVFMDTGAGAKSYSIIAQGEIEKLVQSKPQDRRMIIEEVAGITKFKMRKKESLRKIEQTEYNLHRLEDLQSEIEKNLHVLKHQSEKAEKAQSLRERIKNSELLTESHKVYDILKELKNGKFSLQEKQLELENNKVEKDKLELSLEKERLDRDQLSEKMEYVQTSYNELSKDLASKEAKLGFCINSKEEKEKLVSTREREVAIIKKEMEEESTRLEELKLERDNLEDEANQDHDFSDLEEKVEYLKDELEMKDAQVRDLKSDIEQLQKNANETDQEIYKNNSRKDEFAYSIQDLSVEIESLEKQYSSSSSEIIDLRESVLMLEQQTVAASDLEKNVRSDIEIKKSDLIVQEKKYQEKLKETIQIESNLNSLRGLNESLEGVNEGSAKFLKSAFGDNFHLLGNLLKCDSKYTKAVQSALGAFLDMVVSSVKSDRQILDWHRDNSNYGINFLMPSKNKNLNSEETIQRISLNLESTNSTDTLKVISLTDVVEFPKEYENLKSLMEGFYFVDGLNESSFAGIPSDINFKSLVSSDGRIVIINNNGAKILQLVSTGDQNQGIVARNNKITELGEYFKNEKVELDRVVNVIEEQKSVLSEREKEYEVLRDNLADLKARYAAKKAALDSQVSSFDSGSTRLQILKNRKSQISKQRLELIEREETLSERHEKIKEQLNDLDNVYQAALENLEDIKSSYHDQKEDLVTRQIEAKSIHQRLSVAISRVIDVEKRISKNKEKLESSTNLIGEYADEARALSLEIDLLRNSNRELVDKLKEQDGILRSNKDQLHALMGGMNERENQVRKIQRDISILEKRIVEQEVRLEQNILDEEFVIRNIFEKYQINLRKSVGSFLEYEEIHYHNLRDISSLFTIETEDGIREIEVQDFDFVKKSFNEVRETQGRLQQLKNEFGQLGEINWQAIEDYRRQKLRFDFLNEQEIELKQSLEDLKEAITHIDEKSKARFKMAFEEVSERFQKVFPIIFGGGSAILKVSGDVNDAECGIEIVAQPPGKKMQNINLMSGGEKAMTAVSLIFSIFLVKPSPFCLLDEVDAPLDDANVGRFNELLREMSRDSQFILITHNKRTMEMNDTLYGVTMEEPGVSKAVSVQLQ